MASSALSDAAAIATFVAVHSELYKEQKAGDAAATVEGCFPRPETMRGELDEARHHERVETCLRVLERLLKELEELKALSSKPAAECRGGRRIFFVGEQPLYASLIGYDSEEWLADLKTVADYLLLPKALTEALECEEAVVKARHDCSEAKAAYKHEIATLPKPRLFDFLLKNDSLREILRRALDQKANECAIVPAGSVGRSHRCGGRSHSHPQSTLCKGLLDGAFGEELSEYGFEPSFDRLQAYASGCILAGRDIPDGAIPKDVQVCEEREYQCDLIELSSVPLSLAAQVGSTAALQQFRDSGLDIEAAVPHLMDTAAGSGVQGTLTWLQATYPEAFKRHASCALDWALRKGHTEVGKRLLADPELDLRATAVSVRRSETWLFNAAKRNDLATLKWLHSELGVSLVGFDIAGYAFEHGNKEMLDWYLSHLTPEIEGQNVRRPTFLWTDFVDSLRSGNLDIGLSVVQQESRPGRNYCENWLSAACEGFNGDTRVFDTLLSLHPPLPLPPWVEGLQTEYECLATTAARLGYPQALEWITRQPGKEDCFRYPNNAIFHATICEAAQYAQLKCIRWLLTQATKERLAQMVAANGGRRPKLFETRSGLHPCPLVTQELLDLLEPFYDLTCFYGAAVRSMDVDLVRCLNDRGCKLQIFTGFDEEEPYDDARGREDSVPSWLVLEKLQDPHVPREQAVSFVRCLADECGVDLGELNDLCPSVVWDESLELMQVLVEKGAKLSPSVLAEAARWGHLPMCRWLRQQGVAWPTGESEWLVQRVKWPGSFDNLARYEGADEVAAWIGQEQAKEASGAAGGAGAGHA